MSWPRASTPWRSSLAHLGFGVALSGFAPYCSFFCCRFAAPLPSHWALIKVGLYQCMVQSTLKADWKGISHMSQWCQSTKTFCSGWHHILFQHCKRRRIACVLTTYVALFIVSHYGDQRMCTQVQPNLFILCSTVGYIGLLRCFIVACR